MPNGQTTERNRWEYYTSELQEYFTSSHLKNEILSQTKTRKLLLFVFFVEEKQNWGEKYWKLKYKKLRQNENK
jgi:hypothetical protein